MSFVAVIYPTMLFCISCRFVFRAGNAVFGCSAARGFDYGRIDTGAFSKDNAATFEYGWLARKALLWDNPRLPYTLSPPAPLPFAKRSTVDNSAKPFLLPLYPG